VDLPEPGGAQIAGPGALGRGAHGIVLCAVVGQRIGQSVRMSFATPSTVVPTSDERELLLRFLHRQREEVVAVARGLSDEQARWRPEGRLLSIVGIINHLTHVECRWIEGRYLARGFPPRTDEFAADGIGIAEACARYWTQAHKTNEVVRNARNLDVSCVGREGDWPPAHTLLGLDVPLDLRWVLVHLIEETAHHAGHADATREMLDGKIMRP
jgi:hypothetical protein